jgi:hypothetical protein
MFEFDPIQVTLCLHDPFPDHPFRKRRVQVPKAGQIKTCKVFLFYHGKVMKDPGNGLFPEIFFLPQD